MRKSKRLLACLLALAMIITGCGSQSTNKENDKKEETKTSTSAAQTSEKTSEAVAEEESGISGVNEFPIVKEPTTLRVFMRTPSNVADIDTNAFTKFYEEKTGVHVEWELFDGDIFQGVNLKAASGDYADVWLGFGFAAAEQVSYYDQGIFIDLTDLVEEHGYYIKKMFEEHPEFEKDLRHTNDLLLGISTYDTSFETVIQNKMWVYKPWLDKLGLEVPETTDQFYEMLKAFKEQDPNGNGKADEIPLAARDGRGNQISIDLYLMNAFTTWGRFGLINKDGVASFCGTNPGAKEGIKYMAKLYEEGLIHPESFVMDRARITALGENEIPILGCAPAAKTTQFTSGGTNRMNEYVAIPPLKSEVSEPRTLGTSESDNCTYFSITSQCENPEVALKWIDWFYSEEAYILANTAPGFRKAEAGELGYDGEQAIYAKDLVEGAAVTDTIQNEKWTFGPRYASSASSLKTADYTADATRMQITADAYFDYEPYAVYGEYVADFPMPAEVGEEYLELRNNIKNAFDTWFVAFVTGEKDVDADWDDYVKELEALGLARFLEIFQDYIDTLE